MLICPSSSPMAVYLKVNRAQPLCKKPRHVIVMHMDGVPDGDLLKQVAQLVVVLAQIGE